MTLTLLQGNNSIHITVADENCDPSGFITRLSDPIKQGMTFNISSWGGDYKTMEWLDGGLCTGSCDTSGWATLSNISVKTGTSYEYGDSCNSSEAC